jgi:hypothetical protein
VTAPRSVELDQHILGVVDDERLKRVSGDHLDGLSQMLWHIRLALDVNLSNTTVRKAVEDRNDVHITLRDPASYCARNDSRSAVVMSPLAPVYWYLENSGIKKL